MWQNNMYRYGCLSKTSKLDNFNIIDDNLEAD